MHTHATCWNCHDNKQFINRMHLIFKINIIIINDLPMLQYILTTVYTYYTLSLCNYNYCNVHINILGNRHRDDIILRCEIKHDSMITS